MVMIKGVSCEERVDWDDLLDCLLILFPVDLLTWHCLCKSTPFSARAWLQNTSGSRAQKPSCTAASGPEKAH